MAGIQDFAIFEDDFFGADTFSTAGQGSPWAIADTSSSGTPTYATVSPSATGEVALTLASTNEVENVCLSFGDKLCFDIDNIQRFEARVKVSGCTSGTSIAFGLASARNDDPDALTNHASFRMIGATSTTAVFCESDDGTTDKYDIATGATLATTYKKFVIDFTGGKSNVKFYIDGVRVAASTTFDMSAATSSLQPYVQIQKTASVNVDAVTIDYIKVVAKR
jgi:hypothetical protein